MRFLSRIGLQYRIAGGVILGLATLFSLFGFLAVRAINESKEVALEERLHLAETAARSVEEAVQLSVRQLEAATLLPLLDPDESERELMERQYDILRTFDRIVRLDSQGQVLWTVPASAGAPGWALAGDPQILEAVQGGQTTIVQVPTVGVERPPIAVVVTPIRDRSGTTRGFLAGELSPASVGAPFPLEESEESIHVELVDAGGRILGHVAGEKAVDCGACHTNPVPRPDWHVEILVPLMNGGQPGTTIHHVGGGKDHVIAFYPLTSLPGGIVVEQQTDRALALPRDMERTVIIFGLGALVVTSGAAWFHARTVVRPIQQLTRASERIAAGELDHSVTSARGDEIGILASSFEQMRVKLKASQEEDRRWTEELERRVRERTQELEALNRSRAELLGKLISAQEEERKRIARELHDESAQTLATLLVELQALEESLPSSAREANKRLDRVKSQTTKALTDMRQIILDLRPSVLDELGLVAAVGWYGRTRLESTQASVSVNVQGQQRRLPGPVETAMFRIAQEAINNVAKHAEARDVEVRFEFSDDHIVLLVEDDGKGFDAKAVMGAEDGTAHLGLAGMAERATLLGGKATIESRRGQGTRVRVEIPTTGAAGYDGE